MKVYNEGNMGNIIFPSGISGKVFEAAVGNRMDEADITFMAKVQKVPLSVMASNGSVVKGMTTFDEEGVRM